MGSRAKKEGMSMKKPFSLPEEDKERLTRKEVEGMEWMMNLINSLAYAKEDLARRLETVPAGKQRMNMVYGQFKSLMWDISGTIPERQQKRLDNIVKDMRMQIVPKMTPTTTTVFMTKADAMELVDSAQVKCSRCAEFNEKSERECKLRKLLETVVPLKSYDGLMCPYSKAKWED